MPEVIRKTKECFGVHVLDSPFRHSVSAMPTSLFLSGDF